MDRLPFARGQDLLALAPRYRQLQQQATGSRVCTPAGDTAWLVCGYPEAKALAADPQLARSHPDPAGAAKVNDSALQAFAREGTGAEHRRVRRLLAPAFSAKRMAMLRTHLADLVEQILGGLPAPPVDLHAELSTIPSDPDSAVGRAPPAASRPRRSHHRRTHHPARHLVTPGPATHHV